MYIVRNYTTLIYLEPTDKIKYILTPIPFNNIYGYLGRLKWPSCNLLYKDNYLVKYQSTVRDFYPPDTNPYNSKYTYMPIGSSIHNTQHIRDFENHSNYINLLTGYLNANN